MPRFARLPLAAAMVTLALACQGDRTTTDAGGPSALISDATHNAGNPDFFFLPPMVPNPSSSTDFEAGEFNAALQPAVQVCEGTGATGTACDGDEIALFTMTSGPGSTVRLEAANEQYVVNWHTDLFNLDPALTYRIRVLSGTTVLGFADVELGATRAELKNVNTGEEIPLLDGRTLPIKFRIENAALCDPPGTSPCSSETIVLAQGGSVVLETGDRVDIPAQTSGQVVTVTVQYCDGIDVDLRVFGNCLEVTAEPRLGAPLFPRAVVSLCTLDMSGSGLSEAQEDLITLHRQDNGDIFALPHAPDACSSEIGGSGREPRNFAEAVWRAAGRALAAVFRPRPLYASTAMLDVGGGGETDFFSRFQFALPAQMDPLPGTLDQGALPGEAVPIAPGVLVTDRNGAPVAGVTVHFEVTDGGGTIAPPDPVITGTNGIAQLTSWTLGEGGAQQARAFGRGLAGGEDGPFMPDNSVPPAEQVAVTVPTGQELFNANTLVRVTALQCAPVAGGDELSRGFYVPSWPEINLETVELYFSARTAGSYTIRLTARQHAYDGPVFATATTTVELSAVDTDNRPGVFTFSRPRVTGGSVMTFSLELVEGPSTAVFYSHSDDETCPVVETEDTTPPLSTPRFGGRGMGVKVVGLQVGGGEIIN